MKKAVFLLVLVGFLQISSIQAWSWGKEKETPRLVVHNKTGEKLTVYLKYSKWIQAAKIAGAVAIVALNTAVNDYGTSSGYSSGNGVMIYLNEGILNKETGIRQETTYESDSSNGIYQMYIQNEFINVTKLSKFQKNIKEQCKLKKQGFYVSSEFEIKSKKKLQNHVTVEKKKTTHIYIEKIKEEKNKGKYKVWATQPE